MGLILFVVAEGLVLVLIGSAMLRVAPSVSSPAPPSSDVAHSEAAQARPTGGSRTTSVSVLVLAVATTLASVPAVAWVVVVVANRSRGFDVSDESFYVLMAHRPSSAVASSSDFGFYLRPLLALGGSVAGMRLLGLCVLLGAILISGLAVSVWIPTDRRRTRLVIGAALTVPIAAVALTYYTLWLPTPSYNSLSLALAMLAGATTIAAARGIENRRTSVDEDSVADSWMTAALGFILVLGGAIKPPAFVAAGILCVSVVLVFTGRRWARAALGRLTAGMVAALVVHWAIVTDGPVNDVRRLARGVKAVGLLGGHPARRIWETDLLRNEVRTALLVLLAASILIVILRRSIRSATWRLIAIAVLAIVMALPLVLQMPVGGEAGIGRDGTGWWWVRLASTTLLWTTAAARNVDRALVLGPFVALLAPACALGSGNGFIRMVALSAGLLALGVAIQTVIVAAGWDSMQRVLSLVPALIFVGVGSVASLALRADSVAAPYRLGVPLSGEMIAIDLGPAGRVKVPVATAAYVGDLRAISASIGLAPRECFVDLTGGTPIAALALDARPAAFPWMLGGYPGSAESASYLVGGAGCLDGPILLLEAPGSEWHIARPASLASRSFESVGEVQFSGYLTETQILSVSEPPE